LVADSFATGVGGTEKESLQEGLNDSSRGQNGGWFTVASGVEVVGLNQVHFRTSPCSIANKASSRRFDMPTLLKMLVRCRFTVSSVMESDLAMSRFM
jgi:hypothetical protein